MKSGATCGHAYADRCINREKRSRSGSDGKSGGLPDRRARQSVCERIFVGGGNVQSERKWRLNVNRGQYNGDIQGSEFRMIIAKRQRLVAFAVLLGAVASEVVIE